MIMWYGLPYKQKKCVITELYKPYLVNKFIAWLLKIGEKKHSKT